MSLKVFMEMSGSNIVDVGGIEKDFFGLRPDGGEVVMRDFGAQGIAHSFLDFMSCCLISHSFRVF